MTDCEQAEVTVMLVQVVAGISTMGVVFAQWSFRNVYIWYLALAQAVKIEKNSLLRDKVNLNVMT